MDGEKMRWMSVRVERGEEEEKEEEEEGISHWGSEGKTNGCGSSETHDG